MIDNRTPHLNLPLPNASNLMQTEDLPRIIAALTAIDAAIFGKASTADITAAINSLLDGAPAALDTLNELAAAINDDASFAASVTTALAGKAAVSHTHAMSDITGLVAALASKLSEIPIASASVLGGIKLGIGLTADTDGTVNVTGGGGGGGGSGLPAWSDQKFTPTAGQTVFTVTGGYVAGQIDVILNGATLVGNGDDYTAGNGTTVTLAAPVGVVDTLIVRKWFYLPSSLAVNKAGDTLTGALNEAHGNDVASASSINLNAATGNLVDVTGTVTIGTVVLNDGAERTVRFTGALTLTHSVNFVLPGGADINTAAGDFAILRGYAGGVVRCAVYMRANGKAVVEFVGGTLTSPINFAPSATVASGTTTAIGGASSNLVAVTGTATVLSLGSIAGGAERIVVFDGGITLTHQSTSLILPTGGNIVTEDGDVARFVSLGAGNWRCTSYQRASGRPLSDSISTDVASSGTVDLTTTTGDVVSITGTNAITTLGVPIGAERVVRFTGALTLTNSANLVLPGGANMVTAAGDFARFRGYSGGVVRCTGYMRASGVAGLGDNSWTGTQDYSGALVKVKQNTFVVSPLGTISGTTNVDLAAASEFSATLTASAVTFAFLNTPAAGTSQIVYLRLTNAGLSVIGWPAGTRFVGGTLGTLTSAGVDLLGVKYDSTAAVYTVFVVGKDVR